MTDSQNDVPIQAISSSESQAELEHLLAQHQQRLAALDAGAEPAAAARIQLDIAEALRGLNRKTEAWETARAAFDTFIAHDHWQEAVEACDILYQLDLPESLHALGNGTWLAVTWPIDAQTSIAMLQHIVDETPPQSDGAAVAAATACYLAELRTEGASHESLTFLAAQILAQVAKRHRGIEGEEMIKLWMETLELNDPEAFLPRLARILDVIVDGHWWYDRDALRQRLPVN
ncbi:hypothetical protein QVG61_12270 [Thiohalobacter sp. IOR34]|uniref:hypothetical protein n=1 Tax=Thiohalobacter sp. IOR34 TaxID=3057176 RepID=UPI0025B0E2FE|nr:hypothetical protein [Thiohalobacter sp. IOR34]WJW75248.1 hypothetical protein QVG61_12270 [Thiohalobacter sp. IOR34]